MIGSTDTGLISPRSLVRAGAVGLMALALAGCGGKKEGLKQDIAASRVTTIGVNSYLWRASLDALSFMPLVQTDSNGGVIVTDWYANPANPGERVKVTVTLTRSPGLAGLAYQSVTMTPPFESLWASGAKASVSSAARQR